MAPRTYNNGLRQDAQALTIHRIVQATVQLHGEKGAMATSHAEIADRAGVSVATVYKHFPSRDALMPHCMAAVARGAPSFDLAAVVSARSAAERSRRLVEAVYARYRYFDPWIRWAARDAGHLPEMARRAEATQKELDEFTREVLRSIVGPEVPPSVWAFARVILSYGTWQNLNSTLPDADETTRVGAQALQLFVSRTKKRK